MRSPTQRAHNGAGLAALAALVTAALAAPALGCAGQAASPATKANGVSTSKATFEAASWTKTIDNPFMPLTPGTTHHYKGQTDEGHEVIEVAVLNKTKRIAGVTTRVVQDTVWLNGKLKEDTYDWFAQDRKGNVWYLGEDSRQYENGKVSTTEGSWEAGVNGAEAGIVMPAKPKVGTTFQQEYDKGNAAGTARILSADEKVEGPTGFHRNVLMTKDYTPVEPRTLEHKFYARGIGFLMVTTISGGRDRIDLVKVTR